MSANDQGIVAVTGRAHCQRQVAFFSVFMGGGHFVMASLGGGPLFFGYLYHTHIRHIHCTAFIFREFPDGGSFVFKVFPWGGPQFPAFSHA